LPGRGTTSSAPFLTCPTKKQWRSGYFKIKPTLATQLSPITAPQRTEAYGLLREHILISTEVVKAAKAGNKKQSAAAQKMVGKCRSNCRLSQQC
jgi:hypothetical protein